jgi:hypothetical protein
VIELKNFVALRINLFWARSKEHARQTGRHIERHHHTARGWLLLPEKEIYLCPLQTETEFPLRLKKVSLVALTHRRHNL